MKALSIKQPWASLIANNIKNIENRTWKTNYRGRIYIHSSAKMSLYEFTWEQSMKISESFFYYDTPFSAIIGEVDIVDCVINHPSIWAEKLTGPRGVYMDGKLIYNWVLTNPVLYDEPILNVKGALSFWDFKK